MDTREKFANGEEDLKEYLTGDPVWYISGNVAIRVPMAGLNQRGGGFKAPPAEVPEDDLAFLLQEKRRGVVDWLSSQPVLVQGRVLAHMTNVALRRSDTPRVGWQPLHPKVRAVGGGGRGRGLATANHG